uniref:Serine aminopeptidase S33 domain-containing protein n=1 Tax=Hemiselmis andersenii TaxID=464988 RepID=A0A6U2GTU9_HEMAN|mmetsp:Transcript_38536/g.89876  ORF Transcript_38536/g.89876 Transcript_38536/m.89876 type:complete len:377 (-) Transcript_38536:119-1249(-)
MVSNDMKDALLTNATTPRGTITNSRGIKLAWREWTLAHGQPKGAVFVVHGVAEHSGRYDKIATFLNTKGYEVFALDHQGHGESEGERAHVERFSDYVQDLEQFIREMDTYRPAIANVPRFIMGHSMGGLIAAHTALRPAFNELCIRGVIILSARLASPSGASSMALSMKSSFSPKSTMNYVNTTLSNPMTHNDASDAAYKADPLVYHGALRARFTSEVLSAMDAAMSKARSFDVPVLVMHGTENAINKLEASKGWFAQAGSADKTFVPIPGAYHELHNEADPYGSMFKDELIKWMAARDNVVRTDRGLAISARGLEAPAVPPAAVYVPAPFGGPPAPPQMPGGMLNTFQMPGTMPMPPMMPQHQFGGHPMMQGMPV